MGSEMCIRDSSNTNMTRHYAKFSETVIGRAMEAFGERLASAASAE